MRLICCVVALAATFAAQPVPNFSGKWVIQGAGRGGGRGGSQTLTLNQVGTEVTGELVGGGGGGGGSAAPINNELYDGKVEGGTLSFYEYTLVRQLKTPFVDRRERRRLFRLGRVMRGYIRNFQVRRERIFINVPPATVRHLRFKPAPALAAERPAAVRR